MTKHGRLGYYCKMLSSVVHNNFHQTFWLAPSDQKPALKDNPPKIAAPLSNISVHVLKTKRVRLITSHWHYVFSIWISPISIFRDYFIPKIIFCNCTRPTGVLAYQYRIFWSPSPYWFLLAIIPIIPNIPVLVKWECLGQPYLKLLDQDEIRYYIYEVA